jgi:hypothetical protein
MELTKAEFITKYNEIFADNIERKISEQDLRDFAADIKDSSFFSKDYVAPGASFASLTGEATDNPSIVQLANDIVNIIRGGVHPDYDNLKKLYDFINQQIEVVTAAPIDGGTPSTQNRIIKIRGGVYSNWVSVNPILLPREPGLVTDYRAVVYGDGVKDFVTLWQERETTGTGGGGAKYFISESHLNQSLPPNSSDRKPGDWALVQSPTAVTIWIWNPVTSLWEDTLNEVEIVVDTVLSPTSGNAIANKTVTVEFDRYLLKDGTIEIPQVNGLPAALDAKIEPSELYALLSPLLNQGTGIQIVKNGTDFVFKLVGGLPPGGPVGGDLGGVLPDPLVTGIQGKPVTNAVPTDGVILKFNESTNTWEHSTAVEAVPNASETEKGIVEQATTTQFNNGTDIGETGAPLFVPPSLIKDKFDGIVFPSTPNASETVAGKVEQATPVQFDAGTDTGETGAPLFVIPSLIKSKLDSVTIANASETVKGAVEEATDAEIQANTGTGSTGAKLFVAVNKLWTWFRSLIFFGNLTFSSNIAYDLTGKKTDSRKLPGINANFTLTITAGQNEDACIFHIFCTKSTASAVTISLAGTGITHKDAEVTITALGLPSGAVGDVWHLIGKVRWTGTATEIDWVTRDGAIVQVLSASTSDIPSVGLVNSEFLLRHKQGGNSYGAAAVMGSIDNQDVNFIRNAITRLTLTVAGMLLKGSGTGKVLEVQNASAVERLQILDSGNIGWSGGSYGGGVIVEFQANATTIPTTNPANGFIRYSDSGLPRFRTPSGAILMPVERDPTQGMFIYNLDGLNEILTAVIKESVLIASTTVANTTTRTTIYTFTIPANILKVGKGLAVELEGLVSALNSPVTLTIDVELAGTIISTSGPVGSAGTVTNRVLRLRFNMACRSTGVSGTVIGQGQAGERDFPMLTPATINTTIANVLKISATFSQADPANSLTITNGRVKRYN